MLGLVIAQPIVLGLVSGAGFGLVAVGLVLVYKSSRVFNFAAGEFVTIGAFGTFLANNGFHLNIGFIHFRSPRLPLFVAALVGILASTVFGLLTERFVVRPLADRPKVVILVATAAVAITVIPIQLTFGAGKAYAIKPLIKGNVGIPFTHVHRFFGVFVSWQEVLVVATLAVIGIALALFFSRTDLGLATLASSQEPTATRLMGIRLNRISVMVWGAAGALGGMAGVLLPAVTGNFFPAYGTTNVLIAAFTAAVLGGMTSIPGAFVGGLLVGIVQNMAQFNLTKLSGQNAVAVLVVLVGVLLVRPTGLLGKEA